MDRGGEGCSERNWGHFDGLEPHILSRIPYR